MKWTVIILFLATAASSLSAQENKTFVLYSGLYQETSAFISVQAKLTEAFRRNGYTLIIKNVPFKRALYMANNKGDGDVARVGNLNEIAPLETNNLIKVPVPVFKVSFSVFVLKKNKFEVNGWKSLYRFKSNGYPRGTIAVKEKLPRANPVDTEEQLFRMLIMQRIDTAILTTVIGQRLISRPEFQNIIMLIPPVDIVDTYTYIHKKHQSFIPVLADTLIEMEKENALRHTDKKQGLQ